MSAPWSGWPPQASTDSAAASVWDARVAGAGLAPQSDDFTEDTIASGKWAVWDFGAHIAASIDTTQRALIIDGAANAAVEWAGVYQPKPSNTFSFACKVGFGSGLMSTGGNHPFVGPAVFENALNPAATFICFDWERNSNSTNWPLRIRDVTAWNGASGFDTRDMVDNPSYRWMRGRCAINPGVNYRLEGDWSQDGVNWNEYRAQVGPNGRTRVVLGNVLHFGIAFLNLNGAPVQASIEYFRVWDGVWQPPLIPRNGGYL